MSRIACDRCPPFAQLAGNARHVGLGSDLDGGYGCEQTPADLDTVADLRKLPELLQKRGYGADDIRSVLHGNWLRFFGELLPAGREQRANGLGAMKPEL